MTALSEEPGSRNRLKGRYSLGVIGDSRNRVLFLQRAKGDGFAGGRWGLPGGGIENGESPAAALARELAEELGAGFRVRYREHCEPVRDTHYGGIYELHLFRLEFLGGDIRLNGEHSAFAWAAPEDYADLDTFPGIDEDLAHVGIWNPGTWTARTLPEGFVRAVRPTPFPPEHPDRRYWA